MRQNIIHNAFLYRPWESIRYTVRLNMNVMAVFLDQAVQLAAKRYPYLCVKVCRQGDHYEIGFNDSPIRVTGSRKPLILGSEEAGGHYFAVGFEGDYLFFDVYHYLCDTKGFVPFIKTVLYLYLKSTIDADLDPAEIRLPGEALLPHEAEDPYDSLEIPDDLQPFYSWKYSDSFVPDRRYAKGSARYDCVVKVSAKEYARFFKTNDSSPVVLASYFLKEMIRTLFPDRNGLPVTIGVPHSLRQDLLGENSFHNQLMTLFIRYDERTNKLPVMTQLTASRGSLMLQMEHDNVLCHVRSSAALSNEIDLLKTTEEKRRLCHKVVEPIIQSPETMCISYAGNINWGSLALHMREAYICCNVLAAPLFVQITALNDAFWFCFLQRDETDIYAKTFVDILIESGVPAELTDTFYEETLSGYIP